MILVSEPQLQAIVERIVGCAHPRRIYLYGSHAYGRPHTDSDVDILVVVDTSSTPRHKQAAQVYASLRGLRMPVEIKLDTTEEFERRANWQSTVERQAVAKGRVLYDAGA